jgi:hypothetical protein
MPGGAISDGRRRLDDRHEDGLAGLLAEALIDHPDDATFLPSSSARIDRAAQPRRVLHAVAVGRRLGVLVHLLARCSLGLPFAPACGHYRRPAQRGPSLGGTVRRHGPCHRDHRSRGCARADPGYSWEDGERIVPAVDQVGLRTLATSTNGPRRSAAVRDEETASPHVRIDRSGIRGTSRRAAPSRRETTPRPEPGRAHLRHPADVGPRRRRAAGLGWGQSWLDVGLAVGFYFLSGFGVTATGQPLPDRPRAYAESASITLNTSSRERSSARR